MIPAEALISSQAWKVRLALGVMFLGAAVWIASIVATAYITGWMGNIGALLCVIALAALGYDVRCPRCKTKIIFHSMGTQPPMSWLGTALRQPGCPTCGYRPYPDR
jgi:DNA-directed RNA polymerase subunit RPC12/RpoP